MGNTHTANNSNNNHLFNKQVFHCNNNSNNHLCNLEFHFNNKVAMEFNNLEFHFNNKVFHCNKVATWVNKEATVSKTKATNNTATLDKEYHCSNSNSNNLSNNKVHLAAWKELEVKLLAI